MQGNKVLQWVDELDCYDKTEKVIVENCSLWMGLDVYE